MVAKREPQNAGIPLQPVVEELQQTAEKGGYGAVVPARPYRDRDLADTGMTQLAPASPPVQWPSTLKKVLLVGRNTEDAWVVASEAVAANKGLHVVAAIVNVGLPGAAPAIDALLRSVGWSKEDLALTGAHLSVTATSRSSQWEPVKPGLAAYPQETGRNWKVRGSCKCGETVRGCQHVHTWQRPKMTRITEVCRGLTTARHRHAHTCVR